MQGGASVSRSPLRLAGDAGVVFVDFAGDPAIRAAVHRAAGGLLRHSASVGMSHWERVGATADDLPGPKPEFFFAPAHFDRLRDKLGAHELQRRNLAAWDEFIAQVGDFMEIERGDGPEAVARVWRAHVDGDVDPRRGHVLRLG